MLHNVHVVTTVSTLLVSSGIVSAEPSISSSQGYRAADFAVSLLFVEHGRAPDANVRWWHVQVTPAWKRIGGGCHLNRASQALIEAARFQFDRFATGYMRSPKPLAFMYEGAARPR